MSREAEFLQNTPNNEPRMENSVQNFSMEITLIESDDPLTKTYTIDQDGNPVASGSPFLSSGTARRVPFGFKDFEADFSDLLSSLPSFACIVLGSLSSKVAGDVADITTKDEHQPRDPNLGGSPLIWRGKDWILYNKECPAVLGLDHDAKDLPLELRKRLDGSGGLLNVLKQVCPELSGAALVWRPSVSTGIEAISSGLTSVGGGLHVYMPILDGGDAGAFVMRLHQRLILSGWGYPFVTKAGVIFVRSLIDTAASGAGDRLWFEAPAVLSPGLQHIPGARAVASAAGAVFNTTAALPPLSRSEAQVLESIEAALRASVRERAEEMRAEHAARVRTRVLEREEDVAAVPAVIARLVDADERGVLNGRHTLYCDDGRLVSVADVLEDRGSWNKVTCADPLEPNYGGGRNKAAIFTDGDHPRLYSHAHGGRLYRLAYDEEDFVAALMDVEDVAEITEIINKMLPDAIWAGNGLEDVRNALAAIISADAMADEDAFTELSPVTHDGLVSTVPRIGCDDDPMEALDDDPAIDAMMRHFNKTFAIVPDGSGSFVYRLAYNADLDRRMPVGMTLESFKLLFGNNFISVKTTRRDGSDGYKKTPATSIWLLHPNRRTCVDGFGLDPTNKLPSTVYNLWQGYGVVPKAGDWSKLGNLILDVIADGNEDHAAYILHWLAHLVQFPQESIGVALVLRGKEGTGKGTLGNAILRMMRPHAMQIANSKHLLGAFNAHMRTVLFLYADEAFFAGDRSNEGVLKAIISEDYRINEAKGRDASLGRNRMHLMMSSNDDWVVPASADARRYAVFDVSDAHMQDTAYFGPINEEMDVDGDAAGVAAFLHYLLSIKVDMKLLRKAPATAGLYAQRIASLRGPAKWVFEILTRGHLGSGSGGVWQEHYTTAELIESYSNWSKETKEQYPADSYAIGKFLKGIFPSHRPRVSDANGTHRPPGYKLGALEQAREVFAERQGIGNPWSDDAAEYRFRKLK